MKRRVTIADVAREAGVAPSTVSSVLNNSRYVTPVTKAAINAAIEKLKYRPSSVAQGLSRGQMMSIGVLTKDITSPFHYEIVKGIDDFLLGSAYHSITANSLFKEPEQDEDILDLLIRRGADGVIIVDVPITQPKLLEIAEQLPLIIINHRVEGLEDNCIIIENYQSGYDATSHLIELGHKKIAHVVADPNFLGSQRRMAGYCQALKDAGIPINNQLIVDAYYHSTGIIGAEALFDKRMEFTAIFAGNDLVAYDVLTKLYEHQIRVPDVVSVIGHDDYPLSVFATPRLTTMHTPLKEIGFAAAESILALLDGQKVNYQEFGSKLLVRASTGPVPATIWVHKI